MSYDDCAIWLIDLARKLASRSNEAKRQLGVSRPSAFRPHRLKIAWVGPEVVNGLSSSDHIRAIGEVYGVEILCVPPRKYRDIVARLRGISPLDAVIICGHYVPYITQDAVPDSTPRNLVHFCESQALPELEQQIRTWIEVTAEEVEAHRPAKAKESASYQLSIMLRLMLSHAKVGQFKHCAKQTVLLGIRARRLNVTVAERVLDQNSEQFHDTKTSDSLFLWKDHNDGKQYFLNPRLIERIKSIIASGGIEPPEPAHLPGASSRP